MAIIASMRPPFHPMLLSRLTLYSLRGKVVIVTGASEGIGAAVVEELHARGAQIALVARRKDRLTEKAFVGDLILSGDLTDESFRASVIDETILKFGRIDVLINNAGRGSFFSLTDTSLEEVRSVFELNFFAPFHLTQLASRHIAKVQGTIVNVSSIAGQISLPWLPVYSATKFALTSLTSTQRVELRREGIHVMGVFPGYVNTEFQKNAAAPRPMEQAIKGQQFSISAKQCASAIVKGIENRKASVITPRAGVIPVMIARMWPQFFESRF